MVALSLKISIGNVVKTMQFEPSTMVYDACRIIRERIPEALSGPRESDCPGGWGGSPGRFLFPGSWPWEMTLLAPRPLISQVCVPWAPPSSLGPGSLGR